MKISFSEQFPITTNHPEASAHSHHWVNTRKEMAKEKGTTPFISATGFLTHRKENIGDGKH